MFRNFKIKYYTYTGTVEEFERNTTTNLNTFKRILSNFFREGCKEGEREEGRVGDMEVGSERRGEEGWEGGKSAD